MKLIVEIWCKNLDKNLGTMHEQVVEALNDAADNVPWPGSKYPLKISLTDEFSMIIVGEMRWEMDISFAPNAMHQPREDG